MRAKSKSTKIPWNSTSPTVSVEEARRLLRTSWRKAFHLMKSGRIPSVDFTTGSQPYLRTSYRAIRMFLNGEMPGGS